MSIDLLNTLVAETEAKIKEAQAALDTADAELKELLETSENRKREYDRLLSWADLYDKSSFAAKKDRIAVHQGCPRRQGLQY